jgi:hypothetical protein
MISIHFNPTTDYEKVLSSIILSGSLRFPERYHGAGARAGATSTASAAAGPGAVE